MVDLKDGVPGARELAKVATGARSDFRGPLRRATAASNATILCGIRDIVSMQISQLTAASSRGEVFDAKQSNTLFKLAQTYAILDSATSREQAKYDLSGESAADLAAAEAAARRLLGTE